MEINPAPRPPLLAAGRSGLPSSRPAVHTAKATAPPPMGGPAPGKRAPHYVNACLFMIAASAGNALRGFWRTWGI